MIGYTSYSSDKLDAALLSGYKMFGDKMWGYNPVNPQGCTWAEPPAEA